MTFISEAPSVSTTTSTNLYLEKRMAYFHDLVARGGPEAEEYTRLDCWLAEVARDLEEANYSREELDAALNAYGQVFGLETVLGMARQKPHGYSGDFEIIDRIYRRYVHSANRRWDLYTQLQPAANAVRNRKEYFLGCTLQAARRTSGALRVLNLASGPGRDVAEHLTQHQECQCTFHCVEQDLKAINYARGLCAGFENQVFFWNEDVLRFRPRQQYGFVWSGGLFDYLSDRVFIALLQRFFAVLENGGELVLGNFAPCNPTRAYMEILCKWHLNYRTNHELLSLASRANLNTSAIEVRQEPSGVNLFLHVRK